MNRPVKIIGAGFSGLVTAWALQRRGIAVEIHERSDRPGGLISTQRTPYGSYETAANAMLNSALVEELFRDLNLELIQPSKMAKRKFIYRTGPSRWPLTVTETSSLLGRWLAARIRADHRPRKLETLAQWGDRVLGSAARRHLVSPAIQGIYAGDPERLSASLLLGHLFVPGKIKRGRVRGSVFPKEGMQQLTMTLAQTLKARGAGIHYASPAQVGGADEGITVVATAAPDAANLLAAAAPAVSRALREIEMLPLVCVELFLRESDRPVHGYGCLFPAESGFSSLGVLFDHFLFPHRVKGSAERWIMGGSRVPQVGRMADEALIEMAVKDRLRLGGSAAPVGAFVTRWPSALPHYTIELESALDQIQLPRQIKLAGNYLGRVGLSQILGRAVELADEIAGGL